MCNVMSEWAAWGSLAEEQLAGEAEALLRESQSAPVDRGRVRAMLALYGQSYDTLPSRIRHLVDQIEVMS
ncbi:hypothetical protein NW198_09215 [Thermophilibacter sp. ET337]|uniref:hypothetical protein n=1 Tax=Thermophilibacter sp. ET337 TaxID=2973084 RepID=UPI0021ABCBC4|nr:hypothetical protein [Thermophilibacter sp. ET337]MCR8908787.1 hypothetical protein [Thermophilibacter sp. ET337]